MNVGELRALLAGVPDDAPVKMLYEQFAERDVSLDGSGFDPDEGAFWIVEDDQ